MSGCCSPTSSGQAKSSQSCAPRDLTNHRWSQFLWAVSLLTFMAGWLLPSLRAVLWPIGLTLAGILCVANAARCGRLHCHITGPLLLAGGIVSGLRGFGLLSWSWNSIGAFMVVGLAVAYLPECLFGKYLRQNQAERAN